MSDAVVDTCCLVNLCATGDLVSFLKRTPFAWYVPRAVTNESLYLRDVDEHGKGFSRKVELDTCFKEKVLTLCDVTTPEEVALYVEYARDLDDGEAMALAIAKIKGFTLATDDKKARNRAASLSVPVLTTPEVVRKWADFNSIPSNTVKQVIEDIERRARFIPAPNFPEHEWWTKMLASG